MNFTVMAEFRLIKGLRAIQNANYCFVQNITFPMMIREKSVNLESPMSETQVNNRHI